MKTDLATAIGTAIVGIAIAYILCNLFVGPIEDVSFKTVTSTASADVNDPNPEVFNYKAINPTVEVYVGDCENNADSSECKMEGNL